MSTSGPKSVARVSLSGYIEEGELSEVNLHDLLTVFELGEQTGVLKLSPADPALTVHLGFSEGVITAVKCDALPPLGADLVRMGVDRDAIAAARREDPSVEGVVHRLIDREELTPEDLGEVLRRRILSALLMVQGGQARFSFVIEVSVPTYPGTGTRPSDLVKTLRREAEAMKDVWADTMAASAVFGRLPTAPAQAPEGLGDLESWLYDRLATPTPLWRFTREHGLAFSRVAIAATALDGRGLVTPLARQWGDAPPTPLAPGDPAPRFRLTATGGGEVTLGARRGQRTLLVFCGSLACPLARAQAEELARAAYQTGAGTTPLLVVREAAGGSPLPQLVDEDGELARAYGVRESRWARLHPANFRRGPAALQGLLRRAPGLLPAAFVVRPDLTLESVHYGRYAADLPAAATLGARPPSPAEARPARSARAPRPARR